MIENLNDDTFIIYAMKCYDSPTCTKHEFEEDIKRLKYVKRLIRRYNLTGDLKERLILNHIIVLSNVFGVPHVSRLLFYKMDEQDYPVLKTFLIYLGLMPEIIPGVEGKDLIGVDIPVDLFVAKRLKEI
jgi:hypothetical protein